MLSGEDEGVGALAVALVRKKEGRPMLKRSLRWLMPLIALLMVAACLAFSPILSSHAASSTPAAPAQISAPAGQGPLPSWFWRP